MKQVVGMRMQILIFLLLTVSPSRSAPLIDKKDTDVDGEQELSNDEIHNRNPNRNTKLFNRNHLGDNIVQGQVAGYQKVSIGHNVSIGIEGSLFEKKASPDGEPSVPQENLDSVGYDVSSTIEESLSEINSSLDIETFVQVNGSAFEDCMILDKEQIDWLKAGLVYDELDGVVVNENTVEDIKVSSNAVTEPNALREPNRLWPNHIVYYSFDKTVASWQENKVRSVLSGLQKVSASCITFQERNEGNRIIVLNYNMGCWAEVGYRTRPQYLNLGSGCWETGVIQHEFLHAIGFWHAHSRWDRDDHVNIMWSNILEGRAHNFNKIYSESTLLHYGLPYDYSSLMHYGKSDFGKKPGLITIETKDPNKQNIIGQRKGVTSGDIELIRRAYGSEPCLGGGHGTHSRIMSMLRALDSRDWLIILVMTLVVLSAMYCCCCGTAMLVHKANFYHPPIRGESLPQDNEDIVDEMLIFSKQIIKIRI